MNITKARYHELLNACIDRLTAGENTNGQLEILFDIGFSDEELINAFHFSASDIQDYLDTHRAFECKLCGDIIENDDESLWSHIQLHHEEAFAECQNWETPDMVEVYYDTVQREE